MAQLTNSRFKTKTVSSKVEGYLEGKDLHATIRALIPKAPPGAKISIWVDVPSGGDYAGMPLAIDDTYENSIKFTVTWEETET